MILQRQVLLFYPVTDQLMCDWHIARTSDAIIFRPTRGYLEDMISSFR